MSRSTSQPSTSPILLVADSFHPVNRFAVQRFLNGDVRHRGRRRSAVPMLLTGRKPNHIAWPDFLDRAALALRPSKARRDDQHLTEWMCMPGGTGTRLERHACATNTCRFRCLEQRINSNCASKPISWPFARTLGTTSSYLHLRSPISVLLSARRFHAPLGGGEHC